MIDPQYKYGLTVWTLLWLTTVLTPQVQAEEPIEDKVKMGFVFNFLKFIDWPAADDTEADEPITVGIAGSEALFELYQDLDGRYLGERVIVVTHLVDFDKLQPPQDQNEAEWSRGIEALKQCEVLFFSKRHSKDKATLVPVFHAIEGSDVLTIGDDKDFLNSGGIINFLRVDRSIRFEINLKAARLNHLEIRAKLLRLAYRVIH